MIVIGQAGANQVRYASVIQNLYHANGRTGMGAVFGSKNLKAIAERGKDKLDFHDNEGLKKLASYFVENMNDHPVCAMLKKGGMYGI